MDTSAILAIYFEEDAFRWAIDQIERAATLRMSTVNLAEAIIVIRDRKLHLANDLIQKLLASPINFIGADAEQAQIAALARLEFPLNLGDCFAYALARQLNDSILTTDVDFRGVDIPVILP